MVASIFARQKKQHEQTPSLWRMSLVVGLIGAFLSSVMAASNPTGLTFDNASCTKVFWNTSTDPNMTTYNFSCTYQPSGSSHVLKSVYTCSGVERDIVNCTCHATTLDGKTCSSCSICKGRQATITTAPELQVKSIAANCDGVLGSSAVCNTDCNKGWVGCGGTQQSFAPTIANVPTSAPAKASAAVIPRANVFIHTMILGLAGVAIFPYLLV